jgi:hypothetical protein
VLYFIDPPTNVLNDLNYLNDLNWFQ